MHGGARVAEVLKAQGVQHLFTLCGGHISPILVAAKERGLRIVDCRSEANAVFAADAMARLTGIPGVAAVTAGPGVTNAITALKNAQLAQSPVILLGGATATMLRGRGALQDIDQIALVSPHVKWLARPSNIRQLLPALETAFVEACSGVPGPVFVEVAVDLLYDESIVRDWYVKATKQPRNLFERAESLYIQGHLRYLFQEFSTPKIRATHTPSGFDSTAAEAQVAARRIQKSQRPVFLIGSQSLQAVQKIPQLTQAFEKIAAPVYLSGMARGLLGAEHPLLLRHKRKEALKEADLVVLAGVPADFRLEYGRSFRHATVISVNKSEFDLRKNCKPDVGVVGEPADFLLQLAEHITSPTVWRTWLNTLKARDQSREVEIDAQQSANTENANTGHAVDPIYLCRCIDRALTDKSVLVGDGGDFVGTAAYTVRPRGPLSWLDPGVFGTLGVGGGFAMAAKLNRPDADVWLLYGDGAAGFSIMEFDSFVRHRLPVLAVVGNDAGWTQIERDQTPILGDNVGTQLSAMDYHKVAEACGGFGIRVDQASEVEAALAKALEHTRRGQPALVNVILSKSDFRKGSISM